MADSRATLFRFLFYRINTNSFSTSVCVTKGIFFKCDYSRSTLAIYISYIAGFAGDNKLELYGLIWDKGPMSIYGTPGFTSTQFDFTYRN